MSGERKMFVRKILRLKVLKVLLVLASMIMFPFDASAVQVEPVEANLIAIETEEAELQETEELENITESVPIETVFETEEQGQTSIEEKETVDTESLPAIESEILTETEQFETVGETGVEDEEKESQLPADTEETETEITYVEESKGYAGVSYASWLNRTNSRRLLRSNTLMTEGSATLRHADYTQVKGIDVSEMNTITDWAKVKASGIKVVIIRVGGRYYGSGTIYNDDMFSTNVRNAAKVGLKIGVYFFSQAVNEKEAIEEADFIAEKLAPYKNNISLPVYMDYEWNSGAGYRLETKGGTKEQRLKTIRAFCNEVKKKGYTPGFYSFDYLLGECVDGAAIADICSMWIAHWGVSSPGYYYTGVYDSWQYSSSGNVEGINGDVDLDYWYLPKETSSSATTPAATKIGDNISGMEGIYLITSVEKPGYVITAEKDGNLSLKQCTGKNNQRFIITSDSSGYYQITSFFTGECLDCKSGGTKTGTDVNTITRNNKIQQAWLIQNAKKGTYYITAANSGNNLSADSNSLNIQLGTKEKTEVQSFRLSRVPSDTVSEGWYEIQCASSTGFVLDIAAGSYENKANAQIYKRNGTDAQKMYLQKMNDGYYRIMSAKSGKMLDVKGGGNGENVNIQQYDSNNTNAQRWIILKNDNGTFSFFSRKSFKALTVKGAQFANKSNIQQNSYTGNKGQMFKFSKKKTDVNAPAAEGRYYIVSAGNKGFVVSVAGASLENAANIRLNTKQKTPWQHFILNYLGNGFYTIFDNHSGKAIDVKGGSTVNKANVQQYQANGTGAQIWKLRKNKDGTFTMINKKSGLALDVAAARYIQYTNIQQYKDNATMAQKFYLTKP